MRRIAAIAALVIALTACTPQQLATVEWWNRPTATPVACQQWVGATRSAGFPEWMIGTMHFIMFRESRCVPWAVGPTEDVCLVQIHWPTWLPRLRAAGIANTVDDLKNPGTCMRAAFFVWTQQGLSAWSRTRPR